MVIVLTIAICLAFLEFFEMPAIQEWNPFDANTPRYASPRIGYQHVLADTNFGLGFDIWQAFMPLRGRQTFNAYEQGMFDELADMPTLGVDYNPRRQEAGQAAAPN